MRYFIASVIALLGATFSGSLPAEAKRVALVVGNAAYKMGRLANPVNDARAVAEALERQLKFDTVLLRENLTLDGFRAALRELARVSNGAELGVVFFAGHGIELAGRNYLIPTDAALASAADIDLEAIALDTVLRQLDGVTRLRLVILDACRNSPFPAAKRAVRGLSRIEPDLGTLVAYAARDGTVADDGKGRHSPFTTALLKRIVTPGLDVRRVFGYVSEDVLAATGRAQEPYLYGRLGGDEVYLNLKSAGSAPTPAAPASEAAAAWAAVKDSASIGQLGVVARRYKGTVYAELALARIDELKKKQVSVAPLLAPLVITDEELAKAVPSKPARTNVPLSAAEERALKPRDTLKECSDCPGMVVVPAGSFTMGASPSEVAALKIENGPNWLDYESPEHRVVIPRPFAVGKFEVTFAEWDACVIAGGCTHSPSDFGWGRGKRPVINVSWIDITSQYLPWLTRKTGKAYRLLSEAEWEYSIRGGTTTRYSTGVSIDKVQAQFNADKTADVGSFPHNAFGLYDMEGNVSEWVHDCWNATYRQAPANGSARTTGDCGYRVNRGGSWLDHRSVLRSAYRFLMPTGSRGFSRGFRVARTL